MEAAIRIVDAVVLAGLVLGEVAEEGKVTQSFSANWPALAQLSTLTPTTSAFSPANVSIWVWKVFISRVQPPVKASG